MLHTRVIDVKEKKLSILEAENFISSSRFGASIFFSGTVRNQNNNKSVVGIRKNSTPLNNVLATKPAKSPRVPPPIAIRTDFLFVKKSNIKTNNAVIINIIRESKYVNS